jgi:hypothetical protein
MTNYSTVEITRNQVDGPEIGPAPYLVNNTKLRSAFLLRRYLLAEIARGIFPSSRLRFCMRGIVPEKKGVAVIYSPKYQRASYGNLMTCGSIWLCAVCAAKISEKRRVELVAAVGQHSGGLALITFTMQHKKADKLADNLAVLDQAFENVFHGRFFQKFKKEFGYIGSVKTLEITYGLSGWHVHRHALFFFTEQVSDYRAVEIQAALTSRYLALLEKAGGRALPGLAVDVRTAEKNSDIVAAYLAKTDKLPESPYWGIESELTKSYVKSSKGAAGMTFWELLLKAATGEFEYIQLVREYAAAIKGKASVRYSRGLKELLKVESLTDEELASAPEKDGVEMALLAGEIWRQVCEKKLRAQLLTAAGSGSIEDLNKFLILNEIKL